MVRRAHSHGPATPRPGHAGARLIPRRSCTVKLDELPSTLSETEKPPPTGPPGALGGGGPSPALLVARPEPSPPLWIWSFGSCSASKALTTVPDRLCMTVTVSPDLMSDSAAFSPLRYTAALPGIVSVTVLYVAVLVPSAIVSCSPDSAENVPRSIVTVSKPPFSFGTTDSECTGGPAASPGMPIANPGPPMAIPNLSPPVLAAC